MTTTIPQGSLLDVLKKKMRQTKEEMERYKDECEEFSKRLQVEVMRREEVCIFDEITVLVAPELYVGCTAMSNLGIMRTSGRALSLFRPPVIKLCLARFVTGRE